MRSRRTRDSFHLLREPHQGLARWDLSPKREPFLFLGRLTPGHSGLPADLGASAAALVSETADVDTFAGRLRETGVVERMFQ